MGTHMAISTVDLGSGTGFQINTAPAGFERHLPEGFLKFLEPLHRRFTPRQQELVAKRKQVLEASLTGRKLNHLPPSEATRTDWRIELPEWCAD